MLPTKLTVQTKNYIRHPYIISKKARKQREAKRKWRARRFLSSRSIKTETKNIETQTEQCFEAEIEENDEDNFENLEMPVEKTLSMDQNERSFFLIGADNGMCVVD